MSELDKYEKVPNLESYGLDRPEYILKNGRARNCYGLLIDIEEMQEKIAKLEAEKAELVEVVDGAIEEIFLADNGQIPRHHLLGKAKGMSKLLERLK